MGLNSKGLSTSERDTFSTFSKSVTKVQSGLYKKLGIKVFWINGIDHSVFVFICNPGSNNNNLINTEATSTKGSAASKKSSANKTIKKQQHRRLFFKNGNINISRSNINKRRRRYLTDIFTTLIDLKWRYNILVFAFGFIVSWFTFATAWFLIALLYGDLDPLRDPEHIRCVKGIDNFVSAILFSVETQQTIGYGARYTTERCVNLWIERWRHYIFMIFYTYL